MSDTGSDFLPYPSSSPQQTRRRNFNAARQFFHRLRACWAINNTIGPSSPTYPRPTEIPPAHTFIEATLEDRTITSSIPVFHGQQQAVENGEDRSSEGSISPRDRRLPPTEVPRELNSVRQALEEVEARRQQRRNAIAALLNHTLPLPASSPARKDSIAMKANVDSCPISKYPSMISDNGCSSVDTGSHFSCVHTCAICQEDYQVGEEVRSLLVCGHCFHRQCIDPWLQEEKQQWCPMCKKSVTV